jgi:hypothetical protein
MFQTRSKIIDIPLEIPTPQSEIQDYFPLNLDIIEIIKFYQPRVFILNELMKKENDEIKIDFINNYSRYFITVKEEKLLDFISEPIANGKTGSIFQIKNKLNCVLKQIKNVSWKPFLSLQIKKNTSFQTYFQRNSLKRKDENVIIQCPNDSFNNENMIFLILKNILGNNHSNIIYHIDTFFTLSNDNSIVDGYFLLEKAENDLSSYLQENDIDNNFIYQLVYQILSTLMILKNARIGFHHSDLKTKNIFVVRQENGEISFKIGDFDKSSIFFRNIRFYNNCYNFVLGQTIENLLTTKSENGIEFYQLSQIGSIFEGIFGFHELIMSNPFGFYLSFDIYTFFYSLILEHKIYTNIYQKNNIVWKIYEFLFMKEEDIENWQRFINNIEQIYENKIKGNTKSIKFYWKQFSLNEFKLRVNIDPIYKLLNLNEKNSINLDMSQEPLQILTSYQNQLCTKILNENTAETNVYGKYSLDPRNFGKVYLYQSDNYF